MPKGRGFRSSNIMMKNALVSKEKLFQFVLQEERLQEVFKSRAKSGGYVPLSCIIMRGARLHTLLDLLISLDILCEYFDFKENKIPENVFVPEQEVFDFAARKEKICKESGKAYLRDPKNVSLFDDVEFQSNCFGILLELLNALNLLPKYFTWIKTGGATKNCEKDS